MTEPRRHHYVPQFLLEGFAKKKRKHSQTCVFDKRENRKFTAAIKDVMVEHDFNAIKLPTGVASLEAYISGIENVAAPIIRCLIQAESAAILSDDDRENLAVFIALQLIRGTGQRAQYLDLAKQLREALTKRGLPIDDEEFSVPNDRDVKMQALYGIVHALPEYVSHLRGKDFLLFKAPPDEEFVIGDNPVVMDNHKEFGFRGNIGLALKGIEIYLPLTAHLVLGLWATDICPEMKSMIASGRQHQRELMALAALGGMQSARIAAKKALEDAEEKLTFAERLLEEFQCGGPVNLNTENMDRFNSMQTVYAERYLASASGDFHLAELMIAERPEIRHHGARGKVQ
jgi:hypothetical protein